MSWVETPGFERRPLVLVEDHLYHTSDVLAALTTARADVADAITVCAIGRPGPDTDAVIADWIARYPRLQIAMRHDGGAFAVRAVTAHPETVFLASPDAFESSHAFARLLARLLRPGGLLIQDIQLTTLPFVPADRWWESIYVAATVRGLFAERAPDVRFLSNKRGYAATFGRDLIEAGFDPRDVMDKADLEASVVPTILAHAAQAWPLELRGIVPPAAARRWTVASTDAERRDLERAFDVLVWPAAGGVEIGGRLLSGARVPLKSASHEAATWQRLIDDRLDGAHGLPVVAVGERIGPPGAERAELTNLAARHIHTLRSRLSDAGAIVTIDHAYRFRPDVRVGVVKERS